MQVCPRPVGVWLSRVQSVVPAGICSLGNRPGEQDGGWAWLCHALI